VPGNVKEFHIVWRVVTLSIILQTDNTVTKKH